MVGKKHVTFGFRLRHHCRIRRDCWKAPEKTWHVKLRTVEDLDKKGLQELIVAHRNSKVERRCWGCTGRKAQMSFLQAYSAEELLAGLARDSGSVGSLASNLFFSILHYEAATVRQRCIPIHHVFCGAAHFSEPGAGLFFPCCCPAAMRRQVRAAIGRAQVFGKTIRPALSIVSLVIMDAILKLANGICRCIYWEALQDDSF